MPTFFVYDENRIYRIRKNILALIHYGFSREEAYFIPSNEFYDYIDIINEKIGEDDAMSAARAASQANSNNDPKPIGQVNNYSFK